MEIRKEVNSIHDLRCWSGAKTTIERVIEERKEEELFSHLGDIFPTGATDGEVNDYLWFERDYIYDCLGISDEEED